MDKRLGLLARARLSAPWSFFGGLGVLLGAVAVISHGGHSPYSALQLFSFTALAVAMQLQTVEAALVASYRHDGPAPLIWAAWQMLMLMLTLYALGVWTGLSRVREGEFLFFTLVLIPAVIVWLVRLSPTNWEAISQRYKAQTALEHPRVWMRLQALLGAPLMLWILWLAVTLEPGDLPAIGLLAASLPATFRAAELQQGEWRRVMIAVGPLLILACAAMWQGPTEVPAQ